LVGQKKEISFKSLGSGDSDQQSNFNILNNEGSRFYLNYICLKYSDGVLGSRLA
jgi:hypothetical protein